MNYHFDIGKPVKVRVKKNRFFVGMWMIQYKQGWFWKTIKAHKGQFTIEPSRVPNSYPICELNFLDKEVAERIAQAFKTTFAIDSHNMILEEYIKNNNA